MKKIILFVVLLLCLNVYAKKKNSIEKKYDKIEAAWINLWKLSDNSSEWIQTTSQKWEYHPLTPKEYLKKRRVCLRKFHKAIHDLCVKQHFHLYQHFKDKLKETIQNGTEEQILSAANLYVQTLPYDSIKQKTIVYTGILFPIYAKQNKLSEVYYIYKLLNSYRNRFRQEPILQQSCDYILKNYNELKRTMPFNEHLKGLWLSTDPGKKHLPKFIIKITENHSGEYYAILPGSATFGQKNGLSNSIGIFLIDSTNHITLQFIHIENKDGLSEMEVKMSNEMVNIISQSVTKAIHSTPQTIDRRKTIIWYG